MLLEIREIGAIWINHVKIIERKIKSMWENICLASHLADEFRTPKMCFNSVNGALD